MTQMIYVFNTLQHRITVSCPYSLELHQEGCHRIDIRPAGLGEVVEEGGRKQIRFVGVLLRVRGERQGFREQTVVIIHGVAGQVRYHLREKRQKYPRMCIFKIAL